VIVARLRWSLGATSPYTLLLASAKYSKQLTTSEGRSPLRRRRLADVDRVERRELLLMRLDEVGKS